MVIYIRTSTWKFPTWSDIDVIQHRMELRIPGPRFGCSDYELLACSKFFGGRRCQVPGSRMISVGLCRGESFASFWAIGGVTTSFKHLGDKVGESGNRRKALKWREFKAATSAEGRSSSSPGAVHFVGVGGAGLSALALLALKQVWRHTTRFWPITRLHNV